MAKRNIPSVIREAAHKSGCNEITYVARIGEADVWSFSQVDEDGITVPSGLPLLVKHFKKSGKIETVSGQAALELLASLEA